MGEFFKSQQKDLMFVEAWIDRCWQTILWASSLFNNKVELSWVFHTAGRAEHGCYYYNRT